MESDPLKSAFAAFRAETHGRSEHADATLDRVLASVDARKVRRTPRAVRWIPLAAALAASSAWAALGNDGVLRVVAQLTEVETRSASRPSVTRTTRGTQEQADAPEHVAADAEQRASASHVVDTETTQVPANHVARETDTPPAPSSADSADPASAAHVGTKRAPGAHTPGAREAAQPTTKTADTSDTPSTAVAATDPVADRMAEDARDFKSAYRVHDASDAAASVRAWEGYLAAHPSGRFVPEARYARAASLLRAGRNAEARAALTPFASAPAGSYRQADASRLLRTLP